MLNGLLPALIAAGATIMAAYISRSQGPASRPAPPGVLTLPGYTRPRTMQRIRWGVIGLGSLITLGLVLRWGWGLAQRRSPEPTGEIAFVAAADPRALNPDLQWEAGSSAVDAYALSGSGLMLTAGPRTWPNFPRVTYPAVIRGDFSASIQLTFRPEAPVLPTAQMAGLLVHPLQAQLTQNDDHFPNDWVAVSKNVTDAGTLVGCRGPAAWSESTGDTVWLKLERRRGVWRCAHSPNGENWIYRDTAVDDALIQDEPLNVSVFAYSDTDQAVTVTFAQLRVDIQP